ncbi:BRCA1-A complex subunit RAP80-like isoform X2 [Myxocyprinus asiaticus]|uniref:BRCA1-A complex subunit RAP80-like isoform X2 n=1 Tax=Myxocyprinus asiaticus TaxID=70543 RepID=UPI00222349E2|nr:BRCA1-A complex subunit RAP80-like isoform X2 [Myxocyprinus asiaticus]
MLNGLCVRLRIQMPRRKRTADEGGRRAKVSKVENCEETLVISDSEHEEEEHCAVKTSIRASRWRRRENDSQLQEMTEDEMLDLAMRLSAQEANNAAQRQQLEDDDMQKAIVDSSVKSSECRYEAASSSAQPQQSEAKVILHLRRKLSYPSQDGALHGKQSSVAQDGEDERETTSPLPEMPDLSQTASLHHSSSNSAVLSGPPAASQHVHESSQNKTSDKQPLIKDSAEDDISQSVLQPLCSPFIRQPLVCVEKVSQDLIRASTDSINHINTQDSAVCPTSPDRSQSTHQDSPLPKSPVFTQNDFKLRTDLLEEGNEDSTQIPDEDLPAHLNHKGLSPKSTDADKCLSLSRGSQPSILKCVPVPTNDNADVIVRSKTHDLKQVKDQMTQGENVKADSERAPNTQAWDGLTSHMVLHLTDDDEDDGSEEAPSPSPVFHQETIPQPAKTKISQTQPCISPNSITLHPSTKVSQMSQPTLEDSRTSRDPASKHSDCKTPQTAVEKGERTVSYYWGVPFCPQGQNPDDYTRVIMCQLEVYEKTLKEAQRELIRKAEWSQPVLPERPFGTRRWKRHRAPQLSEDDEENEKEGEKKNNRVEMEEEKEEEREESVVGSEEAAEGGPSETYVVLSSPETKDEVEQKYPFFSQVEPTPATKPFRKDISDDTQIHHPDEEEEEAQNCEGYENEATFCPETQMTENSTPELMVTSPASPTQPQSRADSEAMEVEGEGGAPAVEEEVMELDSMPSEAEPPESQRMECPMCLKLFPLSRIELHAAFCDGEAEDQDQHEEQPQVSLRKRTRRDVTKETQHRYRKSAKMEKCCLCQGFFPPLEYSEHVNLCLKKRNSNTTQGNSLISALDQTERRHTGSDEAGPSNICTKANRGLAETAVMGTSGGSVDCSAITFSPSNTLTSRAEDTNCLIDSSKNSQRLTRKRKFKR